jgi:hypothetical protein
MKLKREEYIEILKFYNINYNDKMSIKILRKMTEKIIAEKLCRCIKKVDKRGDNESRAIGICINSVVSRKKLKIFKFTCKKRPKLKLKKGLPLNADKLVGRSP